MAWWQKLFGGEDAVEKVDYYEEGIALLREGRFHDALTSFRLALKESPGDPVVLQQIAIAYTRIGMSDEAARTYRSVLEKEPGTPGAHYGLAYILLRKGEERAAIRHLEAFLASPPSGGDAAEHVAHARSTLSQLLGNPGAALDAHDDQP